MKNCDLQDCQRTTLGQVMSTISLSLQEESHLGASKYLQDGDFFFSPLSSSQYSNLLNTGHIYNFMWNAAGQSQMRLKIG